MEVVTPELWHSRILFFGWVTTNFTTIPASLNVVLLSHPNYSLFENGLISFELFFLDHLLFLA